jgi:hypothetical protein
MKNNNILNLFTILAMLSFASCSNKPKENLSVYRALASSLNNSNSFISNQNLRLQKSFKEKLADPATKEKALIWYPTAMLAKSLTNQVMQYIDSLKIQLKLEAGLRLVNGIETFNEADRNAVSNLFNKKRQGENLEQLLSKFQNSLLQLNPEIMMQFKNTINTSIRLSDPSEEKQKTFTETFFSDVPAVGALAILCKFQNNVKVMENQIIEFCDNKIPSVDHSYFRI